MSKCNSVHDIKNIWNPSPKCRPISSHVTLLAHSNVKDSPAWHLLTVITSLAWGPGLQHIWPVQVGEAVEPFIILNNLSMVELTRGGPPHGFQLPNICLLPLHEERLAIKCLLFWWCTIFAFIFHLSCFYSLPSFLSSVVECSCLFRTWIWKIVGMNMFLGQICPIIRCSRATSCWFSVWWREVWQNIMELN